MVRLRGCMPVRRCQRESWSSGRGLLVRGWWILTWWRAAAGAAAAGAVAAVAAAGAGGLERRVQAE